MASFGSEKVAAAGGENSRKSSLSSRLSSLGSTLKYRHLQAKYPVKEKTHFDLKPCAAANEGPEIACSETFWATAYTGGGGPVFVGRHDSLGRISADCPVVNGHSSAVSDIAFSPFDASLMATASADCTVKIWQLPHEGAVPAMSGEQATATLTGFGHSVRSATFHPTCSHVLACTSLDKTVRVFDVESAKEMSRTDVGAADIDSTIANLSFNYDGSCYALACKDKTVRVVDARSSSVIASSPQDSNPLGRNLRVEWCSQGSAACSTLFTVSVATGGVRTAHLWDPRKWSVPLSTRQVDTAAGQLFPMYDPSLGACFVVGKGDSTLRVFEMDIMRASDSGSDTGDVGVVCEKACDFPGAADRTTYTGVCMMPKRTCDVRNIECARLLKLTTDSVVPVSITLPRADNLKSYFQDDVFRPIPSMTQHHVAGDYQDWLGASGDEVFIGPFLESLQPTGMVPLSEKPAEEPMGVSRVTSFRAAKEAQDQEQREKDANFNRLTQMANEKASYHPNASMGAQDEVDSDDNWSDSD